MQGPQEPHDGLTHLYTLGDEGLEPEVSMRFLFDTAHRGHGGRLTFGTSRHLVRDVPYPLFVTDVGNGAVHIIDVVNKTHRGYVAPPGTMDGSCGVAASGVDSLVAVSSWSDFNFGDHVVHMYCATSGETEWTKVRVIGGRGGESASQFLRPRALRFTSDGVHVCVADSGNRRASLFRVDDGSFVRHVLIEARGSVGDVLEVEGGWIVASHVVSHKVYFVRDGGELSSTHLGALYGQGGDADGRFRQCCALAMVPGLGLVVREKENARLQVFSTPCEIAMRTMSPTRVAWMAATYRAAVKRQFFRRQCST